MSGRQEMWLGLDSCRWRPLPFVRTDPGEGMVMAHRDRVLSVVMLLVVLVVAVCATVQESRALERSWTTTTWLKDGQVHMLGDLDGELYFVNQFQLWKTDGTPTGTVPLPGPSP